MGDSEKTKKATGAVYKERAKREGGVPPSFKRIEEHWGSVESSLKEREKERGGEKNGSVIEENYRNVLSVSLEGGVSSDWTSHPMHHPKDIHKPTSCRIMGGGGGIIEMWWTHNSQSRKEKRSHRRRRNRVGSPRAKRCVESRGTL